MPSSSRAAQGGRGRGHWWLQRGSAVLLVPAVLYVALALLGQHWPDRAAALDWAQQWPNRLALTVLLLAGYSHAALGLQTIIEDYVPKDQGQELRVRAVQWLAGFLAAVSTALLWLAV